MRALTDDQKHLIESYEQYDLDNLYNLIGNTVAGTASIELRQRYILGTPNVRERGARVVADVRAAVCEKHERLTELLKEKQDVLDPIGWAATIADVILSHTVTAGIPPWSVAVALGKLCNHTLSKLCG
jgi:hypothetical protein